MQESALFQPLSAVSKRFLSKSFSNRQELSLRDYIQISVVMYIVKFKICIILFQLSQILHQKNKINQNNIIGRRAGIIGRTMRIKEYSNRPKVQHIKLVKAQSLTQSVFNQLVDSGTFLMLIRESILKVVGSQVLWRLEVLRRVSSPSMAYLHFLSTSIPLLASHAILAVASRILFDLPIQGWCRC